MTSSVSLTHGLIAHKMEGLTNMLQLLVVKSIGIAYEEKIDLLHMFLFFRKSSALILKQ